MGPVKMPNGFEYKGIGPDLYIRPAKTFRHIQHIQHESVFIPLPKKNTTMKGRLLSAAW